MSTHIDTYLRKRGVKGPWELWPIPIHKFQNIVIIPAYAESEHIGYTLDSLSKCELDSFDETMVVVVVNNEVNAPPHIVDNNQQLLSNLTKRKDPFYVAVIDENKDVRDIQYYSITDTFKNNPETSELIETELTKTILVTLPSMDESLSVLVGFMLDEQRFKILN